MREMAGLKMNRRQFVGGASAALITPMPAIARHIEIDYTPRWQFVPFHERTKRWACLVCHRRAGKTVADINDLIRRAITEGKNDGRYAYLAPYRSQVKDLAWEYLKRFARPLFAEEPNESELRVRLLNGAIIRLYGADNPDALRGPYLDGVVLDEFADMRPSLWGDVIRPMLTDRLGWATFIGTPKGKNLFWEVWTAALKNPDWYTLMLRASDSGILPQPELDAALLDMGTDRFMQEFECSFEAAIQGAFYAEELGRAAKENRIRPLQYEHAVRVHTAWDLGISDSTAIWFVQCVGQERRWIDYYETSGVGLDHYVAKLEEKKRSPSNPDGYLYGNHYFPHDIAVRELTTGSSRKETLEGLGIEVTVVPQHNVLDGINAHRRVLDRSFIDPEKCHRGLESWRQYRREYNERLKDWSQKPLHDWASHGADAGRTFSVGHDEPIPEKQEDRHRRNRDAPPSAWGV